jgi:hypothetical protein
MRKSACNFGWDWDWIDCTYFAMVTMTTIGYGDHPTLNQGLRIFTIFFALVGVLAIGSSVQRVASWFNEQGRLHFIEMQKRTLDKAKKASSLVKEKKMGEAKSATVRGEGGDDLAAASPRVPSAETQPSPPLSPDRSRPLLRSQPDPDRASVPFHEQEAGSTRQSAREPNSQQGCGERRPHPRLRC